MHWYLEFSDFRKTFELGKVSICALTSLLLLTIRILFAVRLLRRAKFAPTKGGAWSCCIFQTNTTFQAFCHPANRGVSRVQAGQEASKTGCCWSDLSWERAADALESPLAHADRGCTTSTAAICPPTPSWEHEQHQSPERFPFLLPDRYSLEAPSTGTSTWCSGSSFQFYLCCQENIQDPKVPWAKLHSKEWIHSSRKDKFSFFFFFMKMFCSGVF